MSEIYLYSNLTRHEEGGDDDNDDEEDKNYAMLCPLAQTLAHKKGETKKYGKVFRLSA